MDGRCSLWRRKKRSSWLEKLAVLLVERRLTSWRPQVVKIHGKMREIEINL